MSSAAATWVADREFGWLPAVLMAVAVLFLTLPEGLDWNEILQAPRLVYAQQAVGGTLVRKLQWLPLYAVAGYILLRRSNLSWALARRLNPMLVAYVAWCFVSVLWSAYPEVTLRRAVQIVGILLMAMSFQVASWRPQQFQSVLRLCLTPVAIASIILVIVMPSLAVHQENLPELRNAWRGITDHKNSLGLTALLLTMLWLHAWLTREQPLGRCLAGALVAIICLLGARSSTNVVVALLGCGLIWLLLNPPLFLRSSLTWLGGLLAVIILVSGFVVVWGLPTVEGLLTPLTGSFGKDLTFSGRTFIWQELILEISHHPWLGTGFGAFWLGAEPGLPSAELLQHIGFFVLQGHNGFLDVLNETGVIGLFLLLMAFIVHGAMGIRTLALNRPAAALHLTFFVCFLIGNLTENNFRLFGPGFALFFFSSATLSRLRLEHDLQAAYPRPHEA